MKKVYIIVWISNMATLILNTKNLVQLNQTISLAPVTNYNYLSFIVATDISKIALIL